ncbi:hypothetical protein UlMin_023422 [Ulmus minor]
MEFQVANPSSIVSKYCRLILPLSKSSMNYIMHIKFLFHFFCKAATRETLEQVMADALWQSGSNQSAVRAVCLVVFGVNHPIDQQRILDWLRDIFPSHVGLYVKNDVVIALASGTMGKLHGCVLITATGKIAYGFLEDGGEARVVGAGLVLGDWGRYRIYVFTCYGHGIVAHALTAVIKADDGRGAQTMLMSSILESIGLSSLDELIRWTYADPSWAHIAALHKHLQIAPETLAAAEVPRAIVRWEIDDGSATSTSIFRWHLFRPYFLSYSILF